MGEIEVRDATPQDFASIAALRWMADEQDRAGGAAAFIGDFVRWANAHPEHHAVIALDARAVVGMAWLAVLARVPGAGTFERAIGDVQTVFLLPEYRGNGVGTRMMTRILQLASERGLMRVTVQSGRRAISLYERAGFGVDERLLSRDTPG